MNIQEGVLRKEGKTQVEKEKKLEEVIFNTFLTYEQLNIATAKSGSVQFGCLNSSMLFKSKHIFHIFSRVGNRNPRLFG